MVYINLPLFRTCNTNDEVDPGKGGGVLLVSKITGMLHGLFLRKYPYIGPWFWPYYKIIKSPTIPPELNFEGFHCGIVIFHNIFSYKCIEICNILYRYGYSFTFY